MALLRYHTALVTGKVSVFGACSQVHLPDNFGKNLVYIHLAFRAAFDERAVPNLCQSLKRERDTLIFQRDGLLFRVHRPLALLENYQAT